MQVTIQEAARMPLLQGGNQRRPASCKMQMAWPTEPPPPGIWMPTSHRTCQVVQELHEEPVHEHNLHSGQVRHHTHELQAARHTGLCKRLLQRVHPAPQATNWHTQGALEGGGEVLLGRHHFPPVMLGEGILQRRKAMSTPLCSRI